MDTGPGIMLGSVVSGLRCVVVALVTLSLALMGGCGGQVASAPVVRVASLRGPAGVSMVHLMRAEADGTGANHYTFSVSDSPDEVAAKVISGEADIAALPTSLAAVLYAKTRGAVRLLAVNTLGVLYVVEDGDSVHGFADLAGRTAHASGQGSNPEYVLRFLLKRNGLEADRDLKLVFSSQHEEVATLLASGKAELGLLPEPFVSTVLARNPRARVAIDLTAEWARTVEDGSQLMMGAVVVRTAFLRDHPAAVRAFLSDYEPSIREATTDVEQTAALCERFGIVPSAAIAARAIPRLNLTFLVGERLRSGLEGYFRVLHAADPASVGGAIPDAGFYDTSG